jgi:hypothetical protein
VLIKAQVEFPFLLQEVSQMKDEATIDLLQAGACKARILFLPLLCKPELVSSSSAIWPVVPTLDASLFCWLKN